MAKRRSSRRRGAIVKTIKGVGKRCVVILSSGKFKFVKNSVCGLKVKHK